MSISNSKISKIISAAQEQARRKTPKPNLLTFAIRMQLHHHYGWTPYY